MCTPKNCVANQIWTGIAVHHPRSYNTKKQNCEYALFVDSTVLHMYSFWCFF